MPRKKRQIRYKVIITMLLTLLLINLQGQTDYPFKGIISFQNSGGKPAIGVKISAFGANAVISNSSGMFELRFSDKKPGDKVRISVGYTTIDEEKIEVVNDKALLSTRIPNDPNDVLDVVVCKLGQRDEAASRYYGILKKASDDEFTRQLKRLEQKIEESGLNGETVNTLVREKEQLKLEKEQADQRIEQQAEYIASINKDNASEMVVQALTMVENGKSISEAIKILDDEKISLTYNKAIQSKIKADTIINNVIEAYKLKINFLVPFFRHREALLYYSKLDTIFENNDLKDLEIGGLYVEYAEILESYGDYELATIISEKATGILLLNRNGINEDIITRIASVKFSIESNKNPVYFYDENSIYEVKKFLIQFDSSLFDENFEEEANIYLGYINGISKLYQECEQEKSTENCILKVDSFFNNNPFVLKLISDSDCDEITKLKMKSGFHEIANDSIYLITLKTGGNLAIDIITKGTRCINGIEILNKLSEYYLHQDAYELMEKNLIKTIALLKQIPDSNAIEIGELYFDCGEIYETAALEQRGIKNNLDYEMNFKKSDSLTIIYDSLRYYYLEKAHYYMQKGLASLNKVYSENNPELLLYYESLSGVFENKGNYATALKWLEKCQQIQENTLNPSHRDLAITYDEIGRLLYYKKEYNSSLEYLLKAKMIIDKIQEQDNYWLVNIYKDLAEVYLELNKHEEYLEIILYLDKIDTKNNYDGLLYRAYFNMKQYDKVFHYQLSISAEGKCGWDSLYALRTIITDFDEYYNTSYHLNEENVQFYKRYIDVYINNLNCRKTKYFHPPDDFFPRLGRLIIYHIEKDEFDLVRYYLELLDYHKNNVDNELGEGILAYASQIEINHIIYYSCMEDSKNLTKWVSKFSPITNRGCEYFNLMTQLSKNIGCRDEVYNLYKDLCSK